MAFLMNIASLLMLVQYLAFSCNLFFNLCAIQLTLAKSCQNIMERQVIMISKVFLFAYNMK